MNTVCNEDCLHCPYEDCILDEITAAAYRDLKEVEKIVFSKKKYDKAQYQKIYYQANRRRMLEKQKKYYQAHHEEVKSYAVEYRKLHREEVAAKDAAYREQHREELAAKSADSVPLHLPSDTERPRIPQLFQNPQGNRSGRQHRSHRPEGAGLCWLAQHTTL